MSWDKIVKLIQAFKSWNSSEIDYEISNLVNYYEKKWFYNVAKKIRKVYSIPTNSQTNSSSSPSSFVQANSQSNLFEVRSSKITFKDIIVSKENEALLKEIKVNFLKKDILFENNIQPWNRILLFGPPWTWKTSLAYWLAWELNIPVLHVNLDSLISSYLWETGKNIKTIFEIANKWNCIFFIDEFDAIWKQRDDSNELWELKRVVTVLLQNIDQLSNNTILLAATNHPHLLDIAIKRRFDYNLYLDYLDKKWIISLFQLYVKNIDKESLEIMAKLSEWYSGSFIKQIIDKSLRQWVLSNKSENIENIILWELAILRLKEKETTTQFRKELIRIIKDKKNISYWQLEALTWIPHSTLHLLHKQND